MSVTVSLGGQDFEIPTENDLNWSDLTDYLVAIATEIDTATSLSIGTANGLSLAGDILSLALATTSAAGAMSAADKTKLDGITAGATAGVTTIDTFGSSPNSAGGTISSTTLTLQPADATNPGGVSTGAQTFAGNKTFTGKVVAGASASLDAGLGLFAASGTANSFVVGFQHTDTSGYSAAAFYASNGDYKGGFGWGNSAVLGAGNQNRLFFDLAGTGIDFNFSVGGNTAALLKGSDSTFRFAASVAIGKLTAPSVPLDVVGAAAISGNLTVGSNVLKVDTATGFIGLGEGTPSHPLVLRIPSAGGASFSAMLVENQNATAASTVGFNLSDGTFAGRMGVTNSGATAAWASKFGIWAQTTFHLFANITSGTGVEALSVDTSGNTNFTQSVAIGHTGVPNRLLDLRNSANTGSPLGITNTNANGFSSAVFRAASDGANRLVVGYGNPSVATANYQDAAYIEHTGVDLVFSRAAAGTLDCTVSGTTGVFNFAAVPTVSSVAVLTQTNSVSGITNKTFTTPTINGATTTGTIAMGTSTISGTPNFSGAATLGGVAILSQTNTVAGITNKTFTTPTINGATLSGTLAGTPTFSGNITMSANLTVDTDTFFVDASNNRVGVGTTSPQLPLHLVNNGSAGSVFIDTYSGAAGTSTLGLTAIQFRAARDTSGSPDAVQTNDHVGAVAGRGYGATGFPSASRVAITFHAAENWSDAAQGTYILFNTTAIGGTTTTERGKFNADGTFELSSGFKPNVRATTATTVTHAVTDGVILASANSGAVTVNLVSAVSNPELILTVVKTDASANAVTLDGSGAQTINGAATLALAAQYDRVTIVSDGANWIRID